MNNKKVGAGSEVQLPASTGSIAGPLIFLLFLFFFLSSSSSSSSSSFFLFGCQARKFDGEKDYYVMREAARLPMKWTAPEGVIKKRFGGATFFLF